MWNNKRKNKQKQNKVPIMSNLQTRYRFKLDYQKWTNLHDASG